MDVWRRKVVGHRIQGGKAIVDIVFHNVEIDSVSPMKWVGDAYELRDELNQVIADLEGKRRKTNERDSERGIGEDR